MKHLYKHSLEEHDFDEMMRDYLMENPNAHTDAIFMKGIDSVNIEDKADLDSEKSKKLLDKLRSNSREKGLGMAGKAFMAMMMFGPYL